MPLIAVVGPTAVGKSKLALHLSQRFRGEIVSADSRQVYRYMDIGTAKPSLAERHLIPHHLIDIADPDEPFSLTMFQVSAHAAIDDIEARRKIPFLVGGSGLYVWSVLEGWRVPHVPPDRKLRQSLEQKAAVEGNYALYQELQQADPVAAAKIMPGNTRRIIRALEVYLATGKPASQLWQKRGLDFPVLIIGLTTARSHLYHMIDSRIDEMIEKGLVEEVRGLLIKGYDLSLPSMSSIGYRQVGMFLGGKLDLASAIEQTKHGTHRIARHQYAWFRLSDERIGWLDIRENLENEAGKAVEKFLDQFGSWSTP
ncbi:MAG: tRNA (adenosine(37)-N6)-dimethylallyltransferase MiaA [Chloroflexi bacterium]|nr:tRNA (adenosine(37)-N6)-dimethylallyltransferase MiaA [Chloroflexota bacterium]MBM3173774.1 tRNA (adenosine(37)-N6)-dimethylallyltransferase MiaA [Chloroflexota bacterium]MBM3175522.1 tRNA (adenosine(37)-N6)-dimethylallyltransferase MiaA [Chloroflexota bacterium]MBM4450135.1 tRNA (adenosine(37)-N6)-dimethylallyltransferase MiaA [Chloroflexota bacterium]